VILDAKGFQLACCDAFGLAGTDKATFRNAVLERLQHPIRAQIKGHRLQLSRYQRVYSSMQNSTKKLLNICTCGTRVRVLYL
jgi:hypothetical protein